MAYLIGQEDDIDMTLREVEMKNFMLSINPELYKKLYPEEFKRPERSEVNEEKIFVPKTLNDLEAMYEEIKKDGLDLQLGLPDSFSVERSYKNLQTRLDSDEPDIDTLLQEALQGQGLP